tara:strand:+ start:3074 stop:3490 length:417 start_codon:yes stop_codon:yes gene_type:complete
MKIKWFLIYVCFFSFIFGQTDRKKNILNPKKAFYYSLIPGLGQVYNKKWLKSFVIISSEITFYQLWQRNIDFYNSYDTNNYPLKKHRYLEKRNKYAWWIGIVYIYGMIDSVVDAHLFEFKNLMDEPIIESINEEEKVE